MLRGPLNEPSREDKQSEAHVEANLAELEGGAGARVLGARAAGAGADAPLAGPRAGATKPDAKPAKPPRRGDNERLEFLGDAVLGLVVAEALFELHPEWREGELTRVRARLVSREHMAQVAERIGLAGICG